MFDNGGFPVGFMLEFGTPPFWAIAPKIFVTINIEINMLNALDFIFKLPQGYYGNNGLYNYL